MNDNHLLTALIINRLPSLNAMEKRRLFDAGLPLAAYRHITIPQLEMIVRRRLRPRSFELQQILSLADRDCHYLQANGIRIILSERMPFLLQQISDPPFLLFVRGDLAITAEHLLAVVGTRSPSAAATRAAFEFGAEVAAEHTVLVSGLARGVDGAVMQGSVRGGGRVVAVLGSGIDYIYPQRHRRLAERIIEQGGAIVSEYSPAILPLRHHFPARNRIISGLARAVMVVEAPRRSGALITAQYALEQGRDLFVHAVSAPRSTDAERAADIERSAGSRALVADGAEVISSVRELRSRWGYIGMDTTVQESPPQYGATTVLQQYATLFCHRPIYRRVG